MAGRAVGNGVCVDVGGNQITVSVGEGVSVGGRGVSVGSIAAGLHADKYNRETIKSTLYKILTLCVLRVLVVEFFFWFRLVRVKRLLKKSLRVLRLGVRFPVLDRRIQERGSLLE